MQLFTVLPSQVYLHIYTSCSFFSPIKNWYWFISLYQCQLRLHTIEPVDSCLGCFTVIISDCGFSFWPTSVFVFVDPNFWFTSSLVSLPWKKHKPCGYSVINCLSIKYSPDSSRFLSYAYLYNTDAAKVLD